MLRRSPLLLSLFVLACSSDEKTSGAPVGAAGSDAGASGGSGSGNGGALGSGGTGGSSGQGGGSSGGTSSGGAGTGGVSTGGSAPIGDASTGGTSSGTDAGAVDSGPPPFACATDCSELDGPCTHGVCHEDAGGCVAENLSDGTVCDDKNPCIPGTKCSGGVCGGGGTPTCALPTGVTLGSSANAPVVGGASGDFFDGCPAGDVLMGWSGTFTQSSGGATLFYLTSVVGVCGTLSLEWSVADAAYLVTATEASRMAKRGTEFFGDFERICPEGELMVGVSGKGYGGGAVVGVEVSCAKFLVKYQGSAWALEMGTPHSLPTAFRTYFFDTSYDGTCPAGRVATGQHGGNYGNVIGGLGVSCAVPSLL